jgi:hypothetical protein
MITPTKGIAPDRALLSVGEQVVQQLDQPATVSQAWRKLCDWRTEQGLQAPVSFGWVVLALDVLHAMGVVELRDDLLTVRRIGSATPAQRR